MKIIKIEDENYPKQLRIIEKPPQKLYVVGNEKILNEPNIAIVGSRKCTEYGKMQAQKFAKELSAYNIHITSGLALGIDTNAHIGCINANGKTIAVLGCGFNKLYPKENKGLFKKIINNGGVVISEYAPYIEPSSEKFRLRNRIISGLSIATLVVEVMPRSGTMITVRYTYNQKKPIFYIQNTIKNKNLNIENEFIKKGAILVTNTYDILKQCNIEKVNN